MFEEQFVTFNRSPDLLNLAKATVLVDATDFVGIHHAGRALAEDFGRVTGGNANPFKSMDVQAGLNGIESAIILGSLASPLIQRLDKANKIDTSVIRGKWETFTTTVVDNPLEGCTKALVIAGSDKRATIYGAYTLSSQIGVSPYARTQNSSSSTLIIIGGIGGPISLPVPTRTSTPFPSEHPTANRVFNIAASS